MVPNHHFHVVESGIHRGYFHAHEVGTPSIDFRDSLADAVPTRPHVLDGVRIGLFIRYARTLLRCRP